MATVNKDFKIKSGLVVEGTTGTINGYDILTESQASQDFIISVVGGSATSENTPDTVVLRDENGDFAAGTITADITGQVSDISNHDTADLAENATNKYFTDARAKDAVAAALGDGIDYVDGSFDVQIATGLVLGGGTGNEIEIDRTTVDAWYDANGAAAQALTDAQNYADALIDDASNSSTEVWSAYKTNTEIGLAEDRAKQHADDEIAALVGSAPALLDTLQELAAALDNDPETINTLQDIAAGKQDALTAGANIDITGATISVTDLDTADVAEDASRLYFTNQRALDATSSAYDATGTAQGIVDALDTDDIEEGSLNLYYTNQRGLESAAQLLTQADTTNITISGTANGLTITAENGVADSDTDDLTEGSNNLYFSDQRAQDALNGTTPNFVAVELGEISKNVAATTAVPVAGIATAYSWLKANYRSAEFLVKVAYGDHTEISKVLLTLAANDNIAITEYGIVGTNGSASSVSAVISGNDVQLQVTTVNNTSTVTVVGTLLA
jgi:hypothetical protein